MPAATITFRDTGTGPAVLFVPGSFSTAAAWRGIQDALPDRYRMITTSLLGYGQTTETRNLDDFHIDHELRMLAEVGKMIDQPVHLVGHSFGATVGLAAALGGYLDVTGITTFEANPIPLIRERGKLELMASVQKMSQEFETAYHAGERYAARRIIDYWGGDDAFSSMPKAFQDYCETATFTNILDWRSVYTFKARAGDFKALTIPVLIVRGEYANAAMLEITNALSDLLPNSSVTVVEGSNHFLTSSHVSQCAALLADHLSKHV